MVTHLPSGMQVERQDFNESVSMPFQVVLKLTDAEEVIKELELRLEPFWRPCASRSRALAKRQGCEARCLFALGCPTASRLARK